LDAGVRHASQFGEPPLRERLTPTLREETWQQRAAAFRAASSFSGCGA
jgi:hypothetical protein